MALVDPQIVGRRVRRCSVMHRCIACIKPMSEKSKSRYVNWRSSDYVDGPLYLNDIVSVILCMEKCTVSVTLTVTPVIPIFSLCLPLDLVLHDEGELTC